jgi:prepilin-type N-terminal cleavage/methylation domain-containing protein
MVFKGTSQSGFTLMEIIVSTTIFAVVLTLMLVLFNFTLKINRKVEALRQVSQAARNFTEFIVRETRNGSIDYSGSVDSAHCPAGGYNASNGATFLALVNRGGDRECFYLVPAGSNSTLWVTKQAVNGTTSNEQVNPANITIDAATFRLFVRPLTDPQADTGGGSHPGVQPFVTITMNLTAKLNALDQPAVIPYQTTVSTDNYGILHR